MYSFFARVGHPDIRWSIAFSYCLHRRHLLSMSCFNFFFKVICTNLYYFFLLACLKIKFVVLPYLILLNYVYTLEELETFLPSCFTTISRSSLQIDVFLLLVLYVRKFTFLTRTTLRLLISLNFTYSYTC
jgi:hypothetical protein